MLRSAAHIQKSLHETEMLCALDRENITSEPEANNHAGARRVRIAGALKHLGREGCFFVCGEERKSARVSESAPTIRGEVGTNLLELTSSNEAMQIDACRLEIWRDPRCEYFFEQRNACAIVWRWDDHLLPNVSGQPRAKPVELQCSGCAQSSFREPSHGRIYPQVHLNPRRLSPLLRHLNKRRLS